MKSTETINKPIIFIDFSRVVSSIGISRHLATCLAQYLTIPKEKIRNMYKKHITLLAKGQFFILDFIKELVPFLKQEYSEKNLIECVDIMPPVSSELLNILKILKNTYLVYLVSDIYFELGIVVQKNLSPYFDGFIFSFQEGYKKSEPQFWEQIKNKINFENVEYFIDDKQKNLDLASKYGISGVLCTPDFSLQEILNKIIA
ncbi:MAG TPA: hypothetical protein PK674_02345 [Candidatus Absconditabacterales bacterium]|nr:hypothetical protein [Candidatus Absconditabacterales bacterium]HOQ79224.1 hypothetical protein [Candidatus Absconditabacterales bacterium]HPK27905.1 hypothetical protein [Candidatus Absconditabacterales bacterium]